MEFLFCILVDYRLVAAIKNKKLNAWTEKKWDCSRRRV
ncbi:MAG: hypothetical protein BWX80_02730 [Candidatus Hydrogenedentes bacterium ADurb.Bin101]|nr:MAG: hypothetical protein BWX80_02730 [Candidatus Hydrogenedentes bacterium ADurb.Bin101]